jgi:hypothetical protein
MKPSIGATESKHELERAGFVQVGSTTWIAARHVERIELESRVDEYVQLVSGQQVKIEEKYRKGPRHPDCGPPVTPIVTRSSVYCGCYRRPAGGVA